MESSRSFSKRSGILRKVLRFVDQDEWHDCGEYIVFGWAPSEVLDVLGSCEPSLPLWETNPKYEPTKKIIEFALALTAFNAERMSRERTTLMTQPDGAELLEKVRALPERVFRMLAASLPATEDLSGTELTPESFVRRLKERGAARGEPKAPFAASAPVPDAIDGLDSHYSNEVVGKLERIVERATALDALKLDRIPNKRVRLCFEEAVRCYLYDFNVACAAMCRAILEAALQEVIDPEGQLRPAKDAKGKEASYFLKLVDHARWSGRLGNALVSPAEQVKDAGTAAVHDAAKFAVQFSPKMEWLLDRTRQILVELYGAE